MRDEYDYAITKAVYQLVDGMCQHPGTIKLEEVGDPNHVRMILRPSVADIKVIVGKAGAGVKSLTWLVERAGAIAGKHYQIEVEDDFYGKDNGPQPFVSDPKFHLDAFKRLLAEWTAMVFPGPVGMSFRKIGRDLRVNLEPRDGSPDDVTTIRALSQVFYPYGYRQGCIIKIRPCEMIKPG